MLNREHRNTISLVVSTLREVQKKHLVVTSEQMLADVQEVHRIIGTIITSKGLINSEERRVLREACQQLYLVCEDIEKHHDAPSGAARIDTAINLLATVAANEVKAK